MKGIAKITEAKSDYASVRYKPYLTAGVERWREYSEQLKPLKKKPVLFVMLNTTEDAEDVADWLRTKYPCRIRRRENAGDSHRQVRRGQQERPGRRPQSRPQR